MHSDKPKYIFDEEIDTSDEECDEEINDIEESGDEGD